MVTVGNFDGFHLGHRLLLKRVQERARCCNAESVVVSFQPHTQHVLRSSRRDRLLTNQYEKEIILGRLGIHRLVSVRFSERLSKVSQESFFRNWIVKYLRPVEILVGPDHCFGSNGSHGQMARLADLMGIALTVVPRCRFDRRTVSSTLIRRLFDQGDVQQAFRLLGGGFLCAGRVVRGRGLGRRIGFPTANLRVDWASKSLPPWGIYAGYAEWKKRLRKCLIHLGPAPSVKRRGPEMEIYIPGFSGNLYGKVLCVWMIKYLRAVQNFQNTEELKRQIRKDILQTKQSHFKGGKGLWLNS